MTRSTQSQEETGYFPKQKRCPLCKAVFECGSDGPPGMCWCNSLPKVMPLEPRMECLCPDCLTKAIKEKTKK